MRGILVQLLELGFDVVKGAMDLLPSLARLKIWKTFRTCRLSNSCDAPGVFVHSQRRFTTSYQSHTLYRRSRKSSGEYRAVSAVSFDLNVDLLAGMGSLKDV
jgi:hypothetical protein